MKYKRFSTRTTETTERNRPQASLTNMNNTVHVHQNGQYSTQNRDANLCTTSNILTVNVHFLEFIKQTLLANVLGLADSSSRFGKVVLVLKFTVEEEWSWEL